MAHRPGPRTYASSSSPSAGRRFDGADSGVGRSGPPIVAGADGPLAVAVTDESQQGLNEPRLGVTNGL